MAHVAEARATERVLRGVRNSQAHRVRGSGDDRRSLKRLRDDAMGSARRCWGEGSRPEGLDRPDEMVSEWVIAGNVMGRRAHYQFGSSVPRGARGNVNAGLGKIDSRGAAGGGSSFIAPTTYITRAVEPRTIDGVRFVFQLTPEAEAPAEIHFFLPQSTVLDLAENGTHTMHNLRPTRP